MQEIGQSVPNNGELPAGARPQAGNNLPALLASRLHKSYGVNSSVLLMSPPIRLSW